MDFETIVIGSGAGGGSLAGELAGAGRSVLLVERGESLRDPALAQDERAMLERRIASDDREISINDRRRRPVVGGLPGGSTALYGAVLLRPSPKDFAPGAAYGDWIEPTIRDWPVQYEELAPYYDRAEDLYGVAGDEGAPTPHLARRPQPYKASLPALEPVNARLAAGFEAQGWQPFPLPLAIDFDRCRRCPGCPGMLCPHDARGSSLNRAVRPRQALGLELWEGCEAERLEHDGRRVRAVWLRERESSRLSRVTADQVVVSGGALGSPALLLRSEVPDPSGQLGRNHMCHLGALAVAGFRRSVGAEARFVKQLGLSDFYLGGPGLPYKLGVVQQIPIPGPRSLAKQLGVPLPRAVADWVRARALLFAGSLEDLPMARNRVTLGSDGSIRLRRRFGSFDLERARGWSKLLARVLRAAGADRSLSHVARHAHDHLAHQVGTCRFGDDPRHAVLDRHCRVHAIDNLYVVDGSFMPTSLGVGPALTIIANALRVSDHLLGRRMPV